MYETRYCKGRAIVQGEVSTVYTKPKQQALDTCNRMVTGLLGQKKMTWVIDDPHANQDSAHRDRYRDNGRHISGVQLDISQTPESCSGGGGEWREAGLVEERTKAQNVPVRPEISHPE